MTVAPDAGAAARAGRGLTMASRTKASVCAGCQEPAKWLVVDYQNEMWHLHCNAHIEACFCDEPPQGERVLFANPIKVEIDLYRT